MRLLHSDSIFSLLRSPRAQQVPEHARIVSLILPRKYDDKELDDIIDKLDVGNRVHEEDLKCFYIIANRHHRDGKPVLICSLCTCKLSLGYRGESHIFPESLLYAYKDIHCRENIDFIWDLSSKKTLRAPSLSVPSMFCQSCEREASKEEKYLKKVYLKIMGSALVRVTEEESHKLRHILAVILFRGALLGINFEQLRIQFRYFYNLFIDLRDYCRETDIAKYKILPIAEKVDIFLLPNTSFSCSNIGLITTLDFQLRNPTFTSLVERLRDDQDEDDQDGDNVFLYTKFDCFHVKLPIIPEACDLTGCFSDRYKVNGHFYLPPPKAAVKLFPDDLLQYNLSLIGDLADQLTRIPNVGCVIQIPKKNNRKAADANKNLMVTEKEDSVNFFINYVDDNNTKEKLKRKWNLSEEQVSQVLKLLFAQFGTIDVSRFIKRYIEKDTDHERELVAREQINQVHEWYDHLWLKLFMVLVCYCCLAHSITFILWFVALVWIVLCTIMYHVYSPMCREHEWNNDLKRNWNLDEEQFNRIIRMFNDYDLYIKEANVHCSSTADVWSKRAQKQSPFIKSDEAWRDEIIKIKADYEKEAEKKLKIYERKKQQKLQKLQGEIKELRQEIRELNQPRQNDPLPEVQLPIDEVVPVSPSQP